MKINKSRQDKTLIKIKLCKRCGVIFKYKTKVAGTTLKYCKNCNNSRYIYYNYKYVD